MGVLSIFMIGIGLSMDAFAVALAKGMTMRKRSFKNVFKIAMYFGGFQALMPFIGWFCGRYFENYIKSFDHWIAFVLLGIIGGNMIYESFKDKEKAEDEAAMDGDDEFSHKSLILLAIATSIDALAVGVSFAFLSVSIIPAITIIGITTFLLSILAIFLGSKLGGFLQKYAELAGGIILIIIGFNILIEHLSN
jgi:putative Mn2+ efflux pump MntP